MERKEFTLEIPRQYPPLREMVKGFQRLPNELWENPENLSPGFPSDPFPGFADGPSEAKVYIYRDHGQTTLSGVRTLLEGPALWPATLQEILLLAEQHQLPLPLWIPAFGSMAKLYNGLMYMPLVLLYPMDNCLSLSRVEKESDMYPRYPLCATMHYQG